MVNGANVFTLYENDQDQGNRGTIPDPFALYLCDIGMCETIALYNTFQGEQDKGDSKGAAIVAEDAS